ncbi:MAG: amphi-Trp domain-containing protein [Pseudomonadota bacterium]
MGKKEIEIKTWLTRDEMVSYLRDLANCLAQGRVVLQRGNEYMEFLPAQSLELEMEGVQKKGQQKISMELSWRQVVLEPLDDPLRIASEPELPAEPQVMADPVADQQAETPVATPEELAAMAQQEGAQEAGGENQPEPEDETGSDDKPRRGRAGRK